MAASATTYLNETLSLLADMIIISFEASNAKIGVLVASSTLFKSTETKLELEQTDRPTAALIFELYQDHLNIISVSWTGVIVAKLVSIPIYKLIMVSTRCLQKLKSVFISDDYPFFFAQFNQTSASLRIGPFLPIAKE